MKIKEKITQDDIIKLCCSLQGDEEYYYDSQGHPIFNTILDHSGGDSWKLYYYDDSKIFHCYTGSGESYDVFELVQRALGVDFKEAREYIIDFFRLKNTGFEDESEPQMIDDWDIFQKVKDYSSYNIAEPIALPLVQENIISGLYPLAAPEEWIKDGISAEVMRAYEIRVDSALQKIVIGHRDADGRLIGVRGRSFDPREVAEGNKYMPIFVEQDVYSHPLGKNLYGMYQNKENIKKIKKVYVAEGEKSVLQLATFYGLNECFAVATCGSSLSKEQISLLLSMNVNEVILGYDREFTDGKGEPEANLYEQKLLNLVLPLLPYVNVSVIMDYDHLLPYKGSPTDCGKEVFEQLYHKRVRLTTPGIEIQRKKRKT